MREYYAQQSFYKGKRSLQRIVKTYEATLPAGIMDYARALVFMGDWLTVQRRVLEGARKYKQAWAALAEHGAGPAEVEELFGAPQPIEQLPVPGDAEIQAGADSYYADALLDVPETGWPANIRIQAIHPPDETPWSGAPGAASPPPATAPATGTANRSPPRTSPCASSSSTKTNPAGCISDPGIWNRNLGHP